MSKRKAKKIAGRVGKAAKPRAHVAARKVKKPVIARSVATKQSRADRDRVASLAMTAAGQADLFEQLRIGQHIKVQPTRLPSKIKVGKRFREAGPAKDAHVAALAVSIDGRRALLEPIVIDAQDNLIDGECRMLAWQKSKLGAGRPIPVHVVSIDDLLAGEYDANAIRQDFRPSELVAIKRAIEAKLAPAARARQLAGVKATDGGRVLDVVAAIGGKSGRSIEKAAKVVEAAEQDPARFGKLKDQMDKTGRVDGPFKRLENMRRGDELRATPPPLPMNGPYHTLAIDFPWLADLDGHRDNETRGYYPYKTMSIDDICDYARREIVPIMQRDCAVWLWIPNFHLVRGCHVRVLEALGVDGSTMLTWAKPEIGQGQRLRGATEHAILAIRGKVPVLGSEQRTWFEAPAASKDHSAKPAEFFKIVEAVTPAPRYAYLFAPGEVPQGWDGHGDRVGKVSAPVAAEQAKAKRNRAPQAKRPPAPTDWNGHAVTMSIDESVTPSESVGACQCGAVFRVPRDWTGPDEIVARGEEMSRLIAEHRKAVGADGKAAKGEPARAPSPASGEAGRGEGGSPPVALPTLERGDKSPPEDVLACLDAVERNATPLGVAAGDYLRGCGWIKGKHTLKLTKFGAKHLARLRELVRDKHGMSLRASDVRAAADAPIRAAPHILVTEKSHAALFAAFQTISHDSGAGASAAEYPVPETWGVVDDFGLLILNAVLAGLDEAELTVFCIGEESESQRIVERRPEFAAAHKLLTAFFEGWPDPPGATTDLPAFLTRQDDVTAPLRAARERQRARFPTGVAGHVVTHTIDWAGEPPMDVGTCQCGKVMRVPRDGKSPSDNVARAVEMDDAVMAHWESVATPLLTESPDCKGFGKPMHEAAE